MCEQVLFVYVFTLILPRLSDPCNFITVLIVTRDAMVNFDILPNLHSIVTLLSGLSDFYFIFIF